MNFPDRCSTKREIDTEKNPSADLDSQRRDFSLYLSHVFRWRAGYSHCSRIDARERHGNCTRLFRNICAGRDRRERGDRCSRSDELHSVIRSSRTRSDVSPLDHSHGHHRRPLCPISQSDEVTTHPPELLPLPPLKYGTIHLVLLLNSDPHRNKTRV